MRANASAPLRVRGLRVDADRRLGDPRRGLRADDAGDAAVVRRSAQRRARSGSPARRSTRRRHAAGARLEHLGSSLADIPGVRARLAEAQGPPRAGARLSYEVAGADRGGRARRADRCAGAQGGGRRDGGRGDDLCLRVGGGAAYAKHGPLERHFRDARAASVMAPTTDLLHDFLGKALCGQELF